MVELKKEKKEKAILFYSIPFSKINSKSTYRIKSLDTVCSFSYFFISSWPVLVVR
jgi:hypothetical protein